MSGKSTDPNLRDLAQRLLDYEFKDVGPSYAGPDPILRVVDKLRSPLIALIGLVGFRTLFARALSLAKAKSPSLGALQVIRDGHLDNGCEEAFCVSFPAKFLSKEGIVIFVAELLGLLVAFIGEGLTLNLVRNSWPSLPDSHTEPRIVDDHDEAR